MMRRHRFALAFILLVAVTIFIGPLLRHHVFVVRDHLDYFQPLRWFTAQELSAGRLPLWNPYSMSGEPWLANPQTGVFYPPSWLFLALPFETAYMSFLLLHLAILGWGAHLLFARRLSQGAALVGAIALMLSGPTLSLLDINNNLATFAWIPLVLWCAAESAWRRGGAVLALAFLAGEPFFASVAAAMFVAVALATRVSLRNIVLTALTAIGLTAIQLLPFLEILRGSDRVAGIGEEVLFRDSMPLRDWIRVAIPRAFYSTTLDSSLGQHFIPVVYGGFIVAVLALVGLVGFASAKVRSAECDNPHLALRTSHLVVLGWLALLVFSIVISTGPAFLSKLPLTVFRFPARMVPLGAMALAALAAIGWDRLRPHRRWADLILVLVIVADLLPRALPLLRAGEFRTDIVPYAKAIGADSKILRVGDLPPTGRVWWISGYLNLYDRRFDAYTAAPFTAQRYVAFHRRLIESPRAEEVAFLPAGYILTRLRLNAPFEPLANGDGVAVYRNPHALPMARVVSEEGRAIPAAWTMDTSSARITVDAPEGGIVVLTQQDGPGWRVTVDGEEREKLLISGVFRGVTVEKGRHEVFWSYRPRSLFAGAAMTIVTLLAMTISVFVKRRRE